MRRTPRNRACTDQLTRDSPLFVRGFGASLAMSCMAIASAAQETDLIILPTVEVKTTEEAAPQRTSSPAPAKAQPASRRAAKPRKVVPRQKLLQAVVAMSIRAHLSRLTLLPTADWLARWKIIRVQ